MGQNFLSLAADQKPLHALPAMRSHQDEIASLFLGGFDNRVIRMTCDHKIGITPDARFFCRLFNDVKESLGMRFRIN